MRLGNSRFFRGTFNSAWTLLFVLIIGIVMISSARSQPVASGLSFIYFRYPNQNACNVYMNYSFHRPHFSLMARRPSDLSTKEQTFISTFNAEFDRFAHDRLAACDLPTGALFMSRAEQERRYAACSGAESQLGIAEQEWSQSRLPAPSNCISPKLSSPGVVALLANVGERQMLLGDWLAASNGRR